LSKKNLPEAKNQKVGRYLKGIDRQKSAQRRECIINALVLSFTLSIYILPGKREDFRAEKSFGKSFSLPLVCSLSVRSSFVHKDRLHTLEGEGSPFVVVFKPPVL
jgi:hypothetical protein